MKTSTIDIPQIGHGGAEGICRAPMFLIGTLRMSRSITDVYLMYGPSSYPCVYRIPKPAHNGDEARQESRVN